MNYHLHRHGQDAVVVSLEELIRRRQRGELTGAESVWREGMVNWEPIDKILAQHGYLQPTVEPPVLTGAASRNSFNRNVIITILAVLVVIFICAGVLVVVAVNRVKHSREAIASGQGEAVADSGRDDALAAASKPVQWNTNTLTAPDVLARQKRFRVQQYLEGYEKNGVRNPACDARALGLITNWINQNHGGPINTNLPPLHELSDALANDPACTDPLVLTVTSVHAVELHEAIRRLERAVAGFPQSRHGSYPKMFATVQLGDKLIQDKTDRQPVLDAQALQYYKDFLKEGVSSESQEDIGEILINGWATPFFTRNADAVCEATRNAGKSYEWLALLLQGENEIKKAWKARGGGYVNTVSEAGWKGFFEHLEQATKHLTAAWKLRPESPLAASRMVYVSLGQNSISEMRTWFDRATMAQFDYAPVWGHLRWGLRPRWYGDPRSMLAFGETALKTGRFDTDVPRMFFDSVADLESELELKPGEHIYGRRDILPRLQEMYEGYISATHETNGQAGWRSTYAVVAYIAGHLDVSRQQLEAIHWQPNPWHFSGWGKDMSLVPAEVAARTGDLSQEIEAAEAAFRRNDTAKALQLYLPLAGSPKAEALTRSFVSNRLAVLRQRGGFELGGWVSLLPEDESFSGWRLIHGECRRLPDGALQATADKNGHMLHSRMPVGREFEVKGSFVVAGSSTRAFQAGLVMGLPDWDAATWYAFRIKRNSDEGDVASFSDGWSKKQILSPAQLDAVTNSFTLRLHDGKVSATVNGAEVFKEVALPKNSSIPTDEFYLGLGAFNDMNSTVIRYRDLQVRKLPSR